MIENISFSWKDKNIITYLKDGEQYGIPYAAVKQVWKNLTHDAIESWRCKACDNVIVFTVLVAGGQGGTLFVWDTDLNDFVHYSEAAYCADFLVTDGRIITLRLVSNFVTPCHIQLWACPFGAKDISEQGKRLYCKDPVSFDDTEWSEENMNLELQEDSLHVVIGDRDFLYADNVRSIEEQKPDPAYDHLYRKWEDQRDPEKERIKGMIT